MSNLITSATLRSRKVFEAALTAFAAASSQDFLLGTEKMTIDYWFSENVGMVKEHVHVGNSDVIMELEEFKTGK